jgi:hypothetical protein
MHVQIYKTMAATKLAIPVFQFYYTAFNVFFMIATGTLFLDNETCTYLIPYQDVRMHAIGRNQNYSD